MADSDKIITVTPNTSVATTHPEIKFVGKDNSPMYIKVLDDNTLSFEGTEGQVFAISPTMSSGDIFSVNDISGVQSMVVNADGTVTIDAQTKSTTIKNNASNTATLILENTNADAIDGPMLEFYRNTPSPADGDDTGAIVWAMKNDNGDRHEYGRIVMEYSDASDGSEDGELIFKLTEAGSAEQEFMRLRGGSRQIELNTSQDDIDLCYNSDATADFFYINANTERMGINAGTSPNALLHIGGTTYIQSATANQLLRIHADTDSSPAPRIEMMRGAHDTWGSGDNYCDWRIVNENNLTYYSGFSTQSSGAAVERLKLYSDATGLEINDAYIIPGSAGTSGQVLKWPSSGTTLEWADESGGGGGMTSFQLEDGDGTEVTISDGKEVKFVEGTGIEINWTDTTPGSNADPYDMTFTVDVSDFMSNGSNNRIVTATGADAMNAEANLTFDGSTLTVTGDVVATGTMQGYKTEIKAVSSNTTLADADSGKTIYWTGGTLTLPATAQAGQQYVVINNTGGSATPALGTSNAIVSGWTAHAAMDDETARTYISPAANKWLYIG